MDRQSKLLDIGYLETRLRDLPELKGKDLFFEIYKSNRVFSKSVYIEFYTKEGEKVYKQKTLRISDHWADTTAVQFIIEPDDFLTKKKKDLFLRTVKNTIKKSHLKSVLKTFKNFNQD